MWHMSAKNVWTKKICDHFWFTLQHNIPIIKGKFVNIDNSIALSLLCLASLDLVWKVICCQVLTCKVWILWLTVVILWLVQLLQWACIHIMLFIFSTDLKTQVAEVFIRSFVMSETRHSAVTPACEEILRRKTDCRGQKEKNNRNFLWFRTNHSRSKRCGCVVYNQHALSFSHQITDVPLLS